LERKTLGYGPSSIIQRYLPPSFKDIVEQNIALVRRNAMRILNAPEERRELEYEAARQSFRDAGKSYGIDESVMVRLVEGNMAALRCAVDEIERRGRPENE
jgi:hypothetical protein